MTAIQQSNSNRTRLDRGLTRARKALLAERNSAGHWEGELSNSALSTATAVTAIAIWDREEGASHPIGHDRRSSAVRQGLRWLAENQNPDGGWGDTVKSFSNISTTALGWAAFGAADPSGQLAKVVGRAEDWLRRHAGGISRHALAKSISERYGKDRTFSVPILTMCALAGRFGDGPEAWSDVIPLPFELAAFPQEMFAALRLPVVSYALPALIAIGQVRHHAAPSANPFARAVRVLARKRTLKVLSGIQPESGGFLEATPLTSFVTMSLAGAGNAGHQVALNGIHFLLESIRPDGSWPIDTNLATWGTTLSVNALDEGDSLSPTEAQPVADWLLRQHYQEIHPYTNAPPGGWAWTDLSGGVPDGDDTPGALLALKNLNCEREKSVRAAELGVNWLLNLQNGDGGIPTFCRGWTNLPFDRSSPDLTAHAIRAWSAWSEELSDDLVARVQHGIEDGVLYLRRTQRPDGAWVPLWFGNQYSPDDENPTYGTARVLPALTNLPARRYLDEMIRRAARWLIGAQKPDGSWSGGGDDPSSIEESALALEALCGVRSEIAGLNAAIELGTAWLLDRVADGSWRDPSPIGFYFAKLWYFDKLYPLVFTVGALGAVRKRMAE